MVRAIGLYGALFGVWLLLSGFFTPFFLGLAVVCCALVVAIALRMDAVDREPLAITLGWRFVTYLPWLVKEIFVANVEVARLILHPALPIEPLVLKAATSQKSELGQVIYANSITLTPGTVSVDVGPSAIQVHCLTRRLAADIESGEMDRRVSRLEGSV